MNKLDAISQRGKGMRVLVGLLKTAITGCSACLLIYSISKLNLSGGITLAYEAVDPAVAILETEPNTPLGHANPLKQASALPRMTEDEMQSVVDAMEAIGETIPSRPADWKGDAITFDADGDVYLYGASVDGKVGTVKDRTTGKAGGTPAAGDAVNDDFFRNAVVIGNSQVVGMQKNARIRPTYYANVGLSVLQFFEKPLFTVENADGDPVAVTAAEALAENNDFRRVYLLFGINEMGWTVNGFISKYETLIDTILTIRPDAEIYVQAILPMNEDVYRSTKDPQDYFSNERIDTFNEAIRAMAERKQVFYLTPGDALTDANGVLPAEAAPSDGIHLSGAYITKWVDYLKTHTVKPGA